MVIGCLLLPSAGCGGALDGASGADAVARVAAAPRASAERVEDDYRLPEDLAAAVANGSAHDFGVIPAGSTLVCAFTVRNATAQPCDVVGVHASCKCLQHELALGPLAAGDARELRLQIDTFGFDGTRRGHLDVALQHADGSRSEQRFEVAWRTHDYVLPEPRRPRVLELGPDQTVELAVELTSTDGSPFEVGAAQCDSPAVTFLERPAAGARATKHGLRLAVRGDATPRTFRAVVDLALVHPRQPRLRLPIEIQVSPAWRIDPKQSLSFGHSKPGERVERRVRVAPRRTDAGFRVLAVAVEPKVAGEATAYLETSVQPPDASGEAVVTVRLVAEPPGRHFFCDLRIETTDAVSPIQRLPLFGFRDPP